MKWFSRKRKAVIAGILSPNAFTCYGIRNNTIEASASYSLNRREVTSRIINSYSLKNYFHSFIGHHSLAPQYFVMAIDQSLVEEKILFEDTFRQETLCKTQLDQNHWYQAAITPEQRFTYQLFIYELKIHCLLITSTTHCLLSHYIPTSATSIKQLKQSLDSWIQKGHSESNQHGSLQDYADQKIVKGLLALSQESL